MLKIFRLILFYSTITIVCAAASYTATIAALMPAQRIGGIDNLVADLTILDAKLSTRISIIELQQNQALIAAHLLALKRSIPVLPSELIRAYEALEITAELFSNVNDFCPKAALANKCFIFDPLGHLKNLLSSADLHEDAPIVSLKRKARDETQIRVGTAIRALECLGPLSLVKSRC